MNFRISDTFTDSLGRLTGDEQKAVKTTAFDLQINAANPGMSFHKLDRARDPNFWSVRVNVDLRLIVHRAEGALLLCYVDHHDKAYDWASRRKLETHPQTGAAQLVELRETVREVVAPQPLVHHQYAPTKPALFAELADGDLLAFGVPAEWLDDVKAADEDMFLELAAHLPAEASESLLQLATGGTPSRRVATPGTDPFAHPDAQRRFRLMHDVEELAQALEYPWDKWLVFLHPAQRQLVQQDFKGPARVSGSAGTGKTIVALHRAVHLARQHPEARVLLCTFTQTLANALHNRMRKLISSELKLAERLEVKALDAVGERLYQIHFRRAKVATLSQIDIALADAAAAVSGSNFKPAFVRDEWLEVVDARQLSTWEAYRDVRRMGRKTRLTESQRELLWQIFADAGQRLASAGLITRSAMFHQLAGKLAHAGQSPAYDFAVIDEAQDIGIGQLKFLAALAGGRSNGLFFAGDVGQRIFQQPFSWLAQGVDIRGRSRTLQVNYRTSHQIRVHADRLLADALTDADGNSELRKSVSAFNGPMPRIEAFDDETGEIRAVANWLRALISEGFAHHEICMFVRSDAQLPRALAAADSAGLPVTMLDQHADPPAGSIVISAMHLAKGLEFKAVAVMACDDDVIPLQGRVDAITDEGDLDEVYQTERHLLYVACTRARDRLLITCLKPGSEFLEDMVS